MPQPLITKIGLKITYLNLHLSLQGASELRNVILHIDGSVQERHNSIADALTNWYIDIELMVLAFSWHNVGCSIWYTEG